VVDSIEPVEGGPWRSTVEDVDRKPKEHQMSIVLVHGGFVDGSGWDGVYRILRRAGQNVTVVQNPTTSLSDDVALTRQAIDRQGDRVVLVGHSYGGAVITEAGNDLNVGALVYVAAFAPDTGESVNSLIAGFPTDGPIPPILPPEDGFLFLDKAKFATAFAADVDPQVAQFMADSQVPWGVEALGGEITKPAWSIKPTRYLVASDDHMIPPAAQRTMAARAGAVTREAPGSHAIYVSRPDVVAEVILQAAASM
jgi:pimeloyl-ACP methyl ester carboxylesterase